MAVSRKNEGRFGFRGLGPVSPRLMWAVNRIPFIDRVVPWFKADKSDMRWLPINEDIELPGSAPMPLELLDRLIEEASHRAIYDFCGCRQGFDCRHYPVEIGCLLMGDSALEGNRRRYPWREVGVEEAKRHVRRAVEAGLVPIVGKARADNFIFNIPDRGRLLTVCLCCECCCITRFSSLAPLGMVEPLQPPLDSVEIEFTDRCTGCGKCAKHCYIRAIEMVDGRAVKNGYCRACGRCAALCPEKAIEMRVTDPEYLEKTLARMRTYVKYD